MAIQIRRGNKADLQVANLLPGEQVLATDTGEVGIKSAGGDIIWYATVGQIGKAGGIMGLPSTLPAVGKMLKMGAGGAPAAATDGVDYGTRRKNLLSVAATTNGTSYALTDSYLNYSLLCIVGTSNAYSNFYQSLILPVDIVGNSSSYLSRLYLDGTNAVTFYFSDSTHLFAYDGFTSPFRIIAVYGIK